MRGWQILVVAAIFLAASLFTVDVVRADADANQPHPHQGVLKPYEPGTVDMALDEDQIKRLGKGKLVRITIENEDTGGTGIGVMDIAAPPDTVWSRITGFEHYPEWVGPVKFCEVYAQSGDTTRTHVKVSGFLYSYEYFLINVYWPEFHQLIWTLDYDRKSEFDDCVGAWFVEAHPEKEGWSRAWFSSDLKLNNPIPGFLMGWIKKKGIKDAISWVKEQSELAMETSAE